MTFVTEMELAIEGMTCASCATRVQKQLNKLDGVIATVNLATETATAVVPAALSPGDLIAAVEQAGYHAHVPAEAVPAADHPRRRPARTLAGRRLPVSAVLALPVLALAMVPGWQFRGWAWLALALATPVALWGAWPFHRAAVLTARHGAASMDTLVSIGVTAAYAWSLYALAAGTGPTYLDVAAGVTVLVLLGRSLEARARRRSGAALRALLTLGAKEAAVLRDGQEVRIPVAQLAVGEEFVVRPGEKIATDGIVRSGHSAVDISLLTGEPVPAEVAPGDAVTGGAVNRGGRLVVRATRVGADTQLAQLARLVTAAQAGKPPVQRLADRICSVFVPVVIGLAAAPAGAPSSAS